MEVEEQELRVGMPFPSSKLPCMILGSCSGRISLGIIDVYIHPRLMSRVLIY
jgi:hypothetical protein